MEGGRDWDEGRGHRGRHRYGPDVATWSPGMKMTATTASIPRDDVW